VRSWKGRSAAAVVADMQGVFQTPKWVALG
jgi:hypothetical protein